MIAQVLEVPAIMPHLHRNRAVGGSEIGEQLAAGRADAVQPFSSRLREATKVLKDGLEGFDGSPRVVDVGKDRLACGVQLP